MRLPRVPLGGARRQDAVHPLTITCPSQLPAELLHNQVLKKHTVWVGPPGGNPSGLGSCPGLRDLECWSRQLLTIPVTLGKGPGCRGQGPELVHLHLHVTQVPGLACVPRSLRHVPRCESAGQLRSAAPMTLPGPHRWAGASSEATPLLRVEKLLLSHSPCASQRSQTHLAIVITLLVDGPFWFAKCKVT